MFDKNGYYTTNKIKSYKARFYIVASERGLGKTYGEKKALFRNYTRRGYKFACIYRTGADLANAVKSWLSPLTDPAPLDKARPVPHDNFRWVRGNASQTAVDLQYRKHKKAEWVTIGYFRALSIANQVKYETFPLDISEVFFDEFAPIVYKKIPGIDSEGEALQIIIDTMDHDSRHRKSTLYDRNGRPYPDIKTIMFCNPRNRNSPLYDYFSIPVLKFGVYRINRDVVCEMIEPTYEDTRGGLSNQARKCVTWADPKSYVREIPKGSVPTYSVRIGTHYYTAYTYKNNVSIIKRCESHTPGCRCYGTLDHLSEEETALECTIDGTTVRKILQQRFNAGSDYFENAATKISYMHDLIPSQ